MRPIARRPRTRDLTYCCFWSALLPWPGPPELQAEKAAFSQAYLAALRAQRGGLCDTRKVLGSQRRSVESGYDDARTHPCEQSSKRDFSARSMSPSTSSWGRLKLSMEKAYTETTLMSRAEQIPNICVFVLCPKKKKNSF